MDADPTQGKRKGEVTSNPMVNTKSAKGKQSHQPPTSKNKKLTLKIQHALRNQYNVASSLVFSLISSLRRLSTALGPLLSLVVSRSPAGLAYRLLVVDHLDLCVLRKEKHRRAEEAGLALSLILRR